MWNNKHNEGFTPLEILQQKIPKMKNKNFLTGFTIIELMAVVLVISIGLLGAMNLIAQVFLYSRLNQAKLTASFLAQEGIEIVRNIRDTNWIEGAASWNEGLGDGNYGVDYLTNSLPDCDYNNYLKFDGSFYNCSIGGDTKFKRTITIQNGADEIQIKVLVEWDDYEVKAIEKIYNWNP